MNIPRSLLGLVAIAPLVVGCASRTAPFNDMDKAQITVLRLAGPPPVTQPTAVPGATGGFTIPGLPPELQNMANQAAAGIQGVIPPGILPPGLIPGQPAAQPQQPQQPPVQLYKNSFVIAAQMPLSDDKIKNDLLDVLGSDKSFSGQRGNCFTPGMAVVMSRPSSPQPVEVLISLSCNQAQGDGFRWPYPSNGFSTDAHDKLQKIYEKLWGPVPSGA
jgi:hypothetical protein